LIARNDTESKALEIGGTLPDLVLFRIDGKRTPLASLRGTPSILVFGSLTSPTFRDHLPDLKSFFDKHGKRLNLLMIYTREAHPAGDWEIQRNIEAEISVPVHQNFDDRLNAARMCRDKLAIPFDILPEPMNDPLTSAANTFPNGAIITNADGKVTIIQRWLDPTALLDATRPASPR
jgi:hypothetical protein